MKTKVGNLLWELVLRIWQDAYSMRMNDGEWLVGETSPLEFYRIARSAYDGYEDEL